MWFLTRSGQMPQLAGGRARLPAPAGTRCSGRSTMAVAWGRDHVDLTGIRAIGIDEIHWQRGSQFLTLVYQIDPRVKRLLWIGQHRRAQDPAPVLPTGSDGSGPPRSLSSAATCGRRISKSSPRRPGMPSTSWTGFTCAKHMSDASIRSAAPKSARSDPARTTAAPHEGALGPPETQGESDTRAAQYACASSSNTTCGRSAPCSAPQWFDHFWRYRSGRLGRGLPGRCVVRPSHALAHRADEEGRPYVGRHRPLILNWFRARGEISAAIVEGFNNKAKLATIRKAYGSSLVSVAWKSLVYHTLGQLPDRQKLPTILLKTPI